MGTDSIVEMGPPAHLQKTTTTTQQQQQNTHTSLLPREIAVQLCQWTTRLYMLAMTKTTSQLARVHFERVATQWKLLFSIFLLLDDCPAATTATHCPATGRKCRIAENWDFGMVTIKKTKTPFFSSTQYLSDSFTPRGLFGTRSRPEGQEGALEVRKLDKNAAAGGKTDFLKIL